MAKEWILNTTMNRFQLNFKRNVGATSESIRKCSPKTIEEWESYYYKNVFPKSHLEDLGRKLYIKITEVVQSELDLITEQDCIDYIIDVVIRRTYEGYNTEIKTIYGQLQDAIGINIESAPDKWDRLYNVDFYIRIKEKYYIGLQIKPVNKGIQLPEIHKEYKNQLITHSKFTEKYKGNVYYVFSEKSERKKIIKNVEVIDDIKKEGCGID